MCGSRQPAVRQRCRLLLLILIRLFGRSRALWCRWGAFAKAATAKTLGLGFVHHSQHQNHCRQAGNQCFHNILVWLRLKDNGFKPGPVVRVGVIMAAFRCGDSSAMQWHIFCRVIDNFGDIGVCWRLAVQLQKDHGQEVSLWVDDLAAFQQIEPEVLGATEVQTVQGIRVFHWTAQTSGLEAGSPADVVIEAFACELPAPLALALQERNPPPHWINLEYLSAEPWVTDFHLGQSPVGRLTKVFFFPGFTAGTGGLLAPPAGTESLVAEMATATARAEFLNSCGIHAAEGERYI